MLSFFRRTLGRRSMRKQAEKDRLREAQRAATHIPAAGDARAVITCRVSLLDGTDVSVDLPVQRAGCLVCSSWGHLLLLSWYLPGGQVHTSWCDQAPRCTGAWIRWPEIPGGIVNASLELVAANRNFQMSGQWLTESSVCVCVFFGMALCSVLSGEFSQSWLSSFIKAVRLGRIMILTGIP